MQAYEQTSTGEIGEKDAIGEIFLNAEKRGIRRQETHSASGEKKAFTKSTSTCLELQGEMEYTVCNGRS